MAIREATAQDMPEIIRMGHDFANLVGVPLDEESMVQTMMELISSDRGAVFVEHGAMSAAVAFPLFFNNNVTVVQELFWWVDPEKRGNGVGSTIRDAIEEWAQSIGADRLILTSTVGVSPEFVNDVYLAHGYMPQERTFSKDL